MGIKSKFGSLISSIFYKWELRKYENSYSKLLSVTFAPVQERQYRKGEGLMLQTWPWSEFESSLYHVLAL